MPILRARFFRTRGVYASVDAFREAIEDGANDLLFPMVENAARRVTSHWRVDLEWDQHVSCLLYTSPSPRDRTRSRMPSSA